LSARRPLTAILTTAAVVVLTGGCVNTAGPPASQPNARGHYFTLGPPSPQDSSPGFTTLTLPPSPSIENGVLRLRGSEYAGNFSLKLGDLLVVEPGRPTPQLPPYGEPSSSDSAVLAVTRITRLSDGTFSGELRARSPGVAIVRAIASGARCGGSAVACNRDYQIDVTVT